jgi:hypothetical protein
MTSQMTDPHLEQLLASGQNLQSSLRDKFQSILDSGGGQGRNSLVSGSTSVALVVPTSQNQNFAFSMLTTRKTAHLVSLVLIKASIKP